MPTETKYYRVACTKEVLYDAIIPATSWEEAEAKAASFPFDDTHAYDERWNDPQVEEEFTREEALEQELIEPDEEGA